MEQILVAASVWLHNLATVVFIGYFVLLAVLVLPALQGENPGAALGALVAAISHRSRPWLYSALLVLAVTGSYLTLVDPNYVGLARFGNAWTLLMGAKHLLLLAMVLAGFWVNAVLRVGPMAISNTGAESAIRRFRLYVNGMAVCGIVILLLTAVSQLY